MELRNKTGLAWLLAFVVESDYSAPTEFCKPDNSLLVPCRIVPVPKTQDHPTYAYVTRWADPDVAAAAEALRRLKANPQFARNLGQAAKAFVSDYFSPANFRASLEKLWMCRTSSGQNGR